MSGHAEIVLACSTCGRRVELAPPDDWRRVPRVLNAGDPLCRETMHREGYQAEVIAREALAGDGE